MLHRTCQFLAFLYIFGLAANAQTEFVTKEAKAASSVFSRTTFSVQVPVASKPNRPALRLDKLPPAAFVVNDAFDGPDADLADARCADVNERCSLRAAIEQINVIGSGIITFELRDQTRIDIVGEPLVLSAGPGDIRLIGPGADKLTIGRDRRSKEGGTIFTVASRSGVAEISGVTVSDGSPGPTSPGSCFLVSEFGTLSLDGVVVENCSADVGGGIANWGSLRITNSTIRNNSGRLGGAVFTAGSMTMRSSAVYDNVGEQGGGINNNDDFQTATIINSTLTGNRVYGGLNAAAYGGAIFNFGPMDLTNVSIAENSALGAGAGFADFASVWAPEQSQIKNTLIAQNTSPSLPDLYSYGLISHGHNLVASGVLLNPAPTDIQGTFDQPIDALLGPLANNGGTTLTMALLPGSPAIDRGGASNVSTVDQRAFPRPVDISSIPNTGDGSDIGAFEVQLVTARITARAFGPWNDPIRIGTAVLIDEATGEERLAAANLLGYFRFLNVPTGRIYRIVIRHKRYTFTPLILSVNGDISDIVITGTL